MLTTVVILALLHTTSVYGQFSCPPSNWGDSRMQVVAGTASQCSREFCFGSGTARTFPFSDPHSSQLVSQNCQVNKHQLTNVACATTADVIGYDCKMCQCSFTGTSNYTWQEYNTDGRTCRSYLCQNLQLSEQNSQLNCSSTGLHAFLPRDPQRGSRRNGMYMASGSTAPASRGQSFDEYQSKWQNYSCPPAADQFCVNNPDQSAVGGAVNYQVGSLYYGRTNLTSRTCVVNKCLPGATPSWGADISFPDNVDVTADATLLSFVHTWCPLENNNFRLSRCYYSSSPGKMYFTFNSGQCGTSNFCNQLYCDCPSTRPDGGMSWYERFNLTRSRGPFAAGMDVPVPLWNQQIFYCIKFSCVASSPRNLTSSSVAMSSVYGGVEPCDPMTGTSSIGEYWSSTTYRNFPVNQRAAAIYQMTSPAINPLGSSSALVFGSLPNATCAALGYGTCWEVKNYDIKTYSYRSGLFCPETTNNPRTVAACSSVSTSHCDTVTMTRDPVVPQSTFKQNGNYIGTKIQCYQPRENLVMDPYCMKNSKLQSTYEAYDNCMNANENYFFNIEPKVQSTGRCSSEFRTRLLDEGKCDHAAFQQYISHRADCICAFVTSLNSGGTAGYNSQSVKAQWETLINADTEITNLLLTLSNYGCNYVPIQCNGGSTSYTVSKKTISATMKVGLPCNEINRFALQRRLQSYWSPADIVTMGANANLRIESTTDTGSGSTAACSVVYKAYVKNAVYADYIKGNLTAGAKGNAGAIYESTSGISVAETAQTGAAPPLAVGYLGLVVSLFFVFA